jgi:hypothetical protein
LGHEVIVAHARNVRLIGESSRKDDQLDARTLARLARIDPELLGPVRHRSAKAQIHLTVIRARAALVSTRTALVNAARGLTKSYGERLSWASALPNAAIGTRLNPSAISSRRLPQLHLRDTCFVRMPYSIKITPRQRKPIFAD